VAKWLTTVKGQNIAFTGQAWRPRAQIQARVRQLGGTAPSHGKVTAETTMLVRGNSSQWLNGDVGVKELDAAQAILRGQPLVVVSCLWQLGLGSSAYLVILRVKSENG
jgi:hypothetical protein